MTTSETVIATLVPRWPSAADAPDVATLSVHLAPRVTVDAVTTLAGCPWLSAWGAVTLTIAVQVRGATDAVPATVVGGPSPTDRVAAWSALLPPDTPVAAFPAADTGRPAALRGALTFSSPAVLALTQHAVTTQVLAPQTVPIVDVGPPPVTVPVPPWLAGLAHRPPVLTGPVGPVDPEPGPRQVDLHERLAYLHDFPFLLRRLGLVLDLAVPRDGGWPTGSPVTVRAVVTAAAPDRLAGPLRVVTPWTVLPARPGPTDGYRAATTFGLVGLDTVHASAALRATTGGPLPVLRASGLSVVDAGSAGTPTRHLTLADRAEHQLTLERQLGSSDVPDAVLDTDDTVLGVVVDVADLTDDPDPRWSTVCGRAGTVRASDRHTDFPLPDGDEGHVADAASARPGEALRLLDVITRWQGWSVVAPRPVAPTGRAGAVAGPGPTATLVPPAGSLPRLRYGHRYAARLRTMNLAGNTPPGPLSPSPAAPDGVACEPVVYLRTEAVGAPVVVLGSPLGRGESLRQPVVYSQAPPAPGQASETRRWILPPRTTLDVAERHGLLDTPAAAPDPARAAALAPRAGAGLATSSPAPGSAKATLAAAQLHTTSPGVPYLPDPLATGLAFLLELDPDTPGLHPPPLRATAAFTTRGIGTDPGTWPQAWQPVALTVRAAGFTDVATMTAGADGVLIELPQGHRARLSIATMPDPAALSAHHAVPHWVQDAIPTLALPAGVTATAYLAQWTDAAHAGGLAQLTPCVQLDLLHAVSRPVLAPVIAGSPVVDQPAAGITQAQTALEVLVDPLTTDKIDVYAEWSAPADLDPTLRPDRADPAPIRVHVGTASVPAALGPPVTVPVAGMLAFHDTLARQVSYQAVATTRFREHFVDPPGTVEPGPVAVSIELPPQLTVTGPTVTALRPSTARPAPVRIHSVVPTLAWGDPVAGPGTVSRSRSGNTVRLWLERPFQTSGYGQQLAVVVSPGTSVSALSAGTAAPRPSLWGADPRTPLVPPGTPDTMAAVFGPSPGFVPAALPDMQNAPADLAALVLDPQYDPELDRWFCDLALPGLAGVFMPVITLLLCGYQPNSVPFSLGGPDGSGGSPDIRFSTGTSTGWFTLVPDCTVTLTLSVDTSFEQASGSPVTNPGGPYTALDMTVDGPAANFRWAFTSGGQPVPLAFVRTVEHEPTSGTGAAGSGASAPTVPPDPGHGGPGPFFTQELDWSTAVPAGNHFTARLTPSADLAVTVTAEQYSASGALLLRSDLTATGVPDAPPTVRARS